MNARRDIVKVTCWRGAIILVLVLLTASLAVAGSGPLLVVQSGTDQVLEVLRNKGNDGRTIEERRNIIMLSVERYFDFEEMAKRALGRPWKEQSPQKQQEFVQLFKKLLFSTYMGRVEAYSNERVIYIDEKTDGEHAQVRTRLAAGNGSDIQVDYRMRLADDQWKVYDVVIEGVSFVNNYRQQFNSVLTSESFEKILGRMREKVAREARI